MPGTPARLLVIAVCMSLAACTTLRPVTDWQPPAATAPAANKDSLKPGDRVTVTTRENQKAELVFVALTADALEGTAGKDKQLVQIPRDQIALVERREISAAKTTGLVVSVVLVALLAAGLSNAAFMPAGPVY